MPRDPRPYITVDQSMPLHDKVRPLSDKAFRLLVEAWCWSKRNRANGLVPLDEWADMSTAKARAELVRRNLAHETRRGIQMHDYLEHQLSAAEESGLTAKRTRASVAGNHKRWHVDMGVIEPSCTLCPSAEEPSEEVPESSHMGSHLGSQTRPNVTYKEGSARETSGGDSLDATREDERPPRTCRRHPSGTEDPCGPCRSARIAHDEWRPPMRQAFRCDEHHETHFGTCRGCESDRKAATA